MFRASPFHHQGARCYRTIARPHYHLQHAVHTPQPIGYSNYCSHTRLFISYTGDLTSIPYIGDDNMAA